MITQGWSSPEGVLHTREKEGTTGSHMPQDKSRNIMSKTSKSRNRVSALESGNQTIAWVGVHITLLLQRLAESEFGG